MNTWTTTPPSEAGYLWGQWDNPRPETPEIVYFDGAKYYCDRYGLEVEEPTRFGPRIPSPEELEASREIIEAVANSTERLSGGRYVEMSDGEAGTVMHSDWRFKAQRLLAEIRGEGRS